MGLWEDGCVGGGIGVLVVGHRDRLGGGHHVDAEGDSVVSRALLGVNSWAPIRTIYN